MKYSDEQIKKMEERKKELTDKIAKAKKALARKNAVKERKRRTHQMCVFGGDVEKIFEEELGEKIWLPDKEAEIEFLKDSIRKTVRMYKGKKFPTLEKPPEELKEVDILESLSVDEEEDIFKPDSF